MVLKSVFLKTFILLLLELSPGKLQPELLNPTKDFTNYIPYNYYIFVYCPRVLHARTLTSLFKRVKKRFWRIKKIGRVGFVLVCLS